MDATQQRSTVTNGAGTVSRQKKKDLRYLATALVLSKECEMLDAFRRRAEDNALHYPIPKVIMPFSASSAAHALSGNCRNRDEREILATAFDEVAGFYSRGSRENEFLQDVAAGIRGNGTR